MTPTIPDTGAEATYGRPMEWTCACRRINNTLSNYCGNCGRLNVRRTPSPPETTGESVEVARELWRWLRSPKPEQMDDGSVVQHIATVLDTFRAAGKGERK